MVLRVLRSIAAVLDIGFAMTGQGHGRSVAQPSPVVRPIAGGADSDTSLVLELLARGAVCLDCLVSTTGLPMRTVTGVLRQLSGATLLTVGLCSRCGESDRVLCGLTR